MEIERTSLGYTQSEWAKLLGMSLSSYKRLIYSDIDKIGMDLPERFYKLTGRPLFDSPLTGIIQQMKKLSPDQLDFLKLVIDYQVNYPERYKTLEKITRLIINENTESEKDKER